MRVYVPLQPDDLALPRPPQRPAVTVQEIPGEKPADWEVRLEEALREAAFASLELIFSSGSTARIVAVGEVLDPGDWTDFESIHVDDPETAKVVRAAREAETQEELDEVVAALEAAPLDWYDVSELALLRQRFTA